MGEGFSRATEPEALVVFKELPSNTSLDNILIPEKPENRVPTDRKFLIAFIVIVLILLPFLIYTFVYSDWGRYKGYDPCGNVCGQKNAKYDKWSCSGADETDKPYLQYETYIEAHSGILLRTPRRCVATCDYGYKRAFGNCFQIREIYQDSSEENAYSQKDSFENVSDYLNEVAWRIVLACALSLAVGMGMLVLFKVATAVVVWGMIGGVLLFSAIVSLFFWYSFFVIKVSNKAQAKVSLIVAILFTILTLILLCITVFMFKKMQLVIQILKEAAKAAFAMPGLIFVPIITLITELIILVLFIVSTFLISMSGVLTEISAGYLQYQQNVVMDITFFLNIIVVIWSIEFIIGIQYMVIGGAVAKWYWAKNKNNLDSPIATSALVAFKFHLGSIAFGSLFVTIIAIIRALLTYLTKNKTVRAIVHVCTGALESFLKFLSKNAYILIAMHGKPFYKSGKRAAKIIWKNAVNIIAINVLGDFILVMAQLLIILISMLITAGIMSGANKEYQEYEYIVYLIVFIISLSIAALGFSIFETAVDTIFLCFCEDSLLNDGMARPYAMSRDLMEFVENSKKIYGEIEN